MIKLISWLGTVTSIVGSFALSLGFAKIGYSLFIIGSLSWLIVAIVKRDKALLVLNGTFFAANLIGIYRAFV